MPPRPTPPRPQSSKIGQTELGNRGVASAPTPSMGQGSSNRTSITTYFTRPPKPGESASPVLFSGDPLWTRVTVVLETAGPVAVGTLSQLNPVLSGKGALLETGKEAVFDIAKGTKLYIASTAVNRVKIYTQPLPWLEQITGLLSHLVGALTGRK